MMFQPEMIREVGATSTIPLASASAFHSAVIPAALPKEPCSKRIMGAGVFAVSGT